MSYLQNLYRDQPSNLKEKIEQYTTSPNDIDIEVTSLENLLQSDSYEKALSIFCIEILAKSIKKQDNFSRFIDVVLSHIEKINNYKNSIFILRIIKLLINTRFFIPLSFYLTSQLSFAVEAKKLKPTHKRFSYDDIRLSSDDLQTEELQTFIIKECLDMLRKNCQIFGNKIGFPEFAFVLCNELRSKCKIGEFKEIISDLINYITLRKTYIEEERAKIKSDSLNGKIISDFEAGLKRWD